MSDIKLAFPLEDVTSTFDQIVKVTCGTVPFPGPSATTEVTCCQFSAFRAEVYLQGYSPVFEYLEVYIHEW